MSGAGADSIAQLLQRSGESTGIHASVVRSIGRRIVAGDLLAGDILPEQGELSRLLGVSRTVVREATKVLAAKGLVESRPKRGTVVNQRSSWRLLDPDVLTWQSEGGLEPEFLESVFEVRRIIEPAAARLAAERASDGEVAAIRHALESMHADEDEASYVNADIRYHSMLVAATHNDYLIQLGAAFGPALQAGLGAGLRAGLRATPPTPTFWPDFLGFSLPLHLDVLEAVAAHDPDRAAVAMLRLIERSQHGTLERIAAARE